MRRRRSPGGKARISIRLDEDMGYLFFFGAAEGWGGAVGYQTDEALLACARYNESCNSPSRSMSALWGGLRSAGAEKCST
jgi:hypothetical protein